MKKLTFKVSSQKDNSFVSLIKSVDTISCRISFDFENGLITVENVNDVMIDSVIELINTYYTIVGVDIDNIIEDNTENPIPLIAAKSISDVSSNTIETDETSVKNNPTVLEPQTEDDLIIKKVEFQNKYLEELINKYVRTLSLAMFQMNISKKEIGSYIYSSINEISMRYTKKDCISFSIGDVVDCCYGIHLPGEINGLHVSAIVCDIYYNSMVYLVPITKVQTDLDSHSYLTLRVPEDVVYENIYYKGGTALLDKAKYVRIERLNSVIGKTTPAFFEKILKKLASTFDFTKNSVKIVEEESKSHLAITENTAKMVTKSYKPEEDAFKIVGSSDDNTNKKVEQFKSSTKKHNTEDILQEVIGFALDKIDSSKKVDDQVENFLADIGMVSTEKMIIQSFIIACDIKKDAYANVKRITYATVSHRLREKFPEEDYSFIDNALKEAFKDWLEKYPTLAEKCPKISIMSMLKLFAKKFA